MLLEQLVAPDRREAFNRDEVLYHKDIGFPKDVVMPRGFTPKMYLNYGGHARYEAMADRYGQMKLPKMVDITKGQIIEIGVTNQMTGNQYEKVVTKMVVRFPYDDKKDLVIVIMIPTGFVKTVWANLKTDSHKTLDRSKYADPGKDALRANA